MKCNLFRTIWVVFTCLILYNTVFAEEVYASDRIFYGIDEEDTTVTEVFSRDNTIDINGYDGNSNFIINDQNVPSGGIVSNSSEN